MGKEDERAAAASVRAMFGAIARRYDFLNHFLSLNIDRYWRKVCLREVKARIGRAEPKILDIGCGTADLSIEFSSLGPVIGCDFSRPMLRIGSEKIAHSRGYAVSLLEGDALNLPFPDHSFDVAVSAFVLRNLANIPKGLSEMKRVLRPGGVVGILDFGLPRAPLLGRLYMFYFSRILPRLGRIVSGVRGAYTYLPESVQAFPPAEELRSRVESAGFEAVQYRLMTGGIAVLCIGRA